MQISGGAATKQAGTARIAVLVIGLCLWAVAVLASLLTTGDLTARVALAGSVTVAVFTTFRAAFTGIGAERVFWALLGSGVLCGAAGALLRLGNWPELLSSGMMLVALGLLVSQTTRRVLEVAVVEMAAVIVAAGLLLAYFSGRAEWLELGGAVLGVGMLYLVLVAMSAGAGPTFAVELAAGFAAIAGGELAQLLVGQGLMAPLLTALGLVFVAAGALGGSGGLAHGYGISPWRVFAFWFGPLSPAALYAFLLGWAATRPPVPSYVLWGGAVLMGVLALRISVVSRASHRLRLDDRRSSIELERGRLYAELRELAERGPERVDGSLRRCMNVVEEGAPGADALREAESACQEAGYLIGLQMGELRILCGEERDPQGALEGLASEIEAVWRLKVLRDLNADSAVLSREQLAAAYRVCGEALLNTARHSGRRDIRLQSRLVGTTFVLKVSDEGRGFDPRKPEKGYGIPIMRRRMEEAGGRLDLVSSPGGGTRVQVRFAISL